MQIHNTSTRSSLLLAAAFVSSCGTARSAPAKAPPAAKHAVKKTPAKVQKKTATAVKTSASSETELPVKAVRLKPRLPLETVLLFRNTEPSAPPGTLVMLGGFMNFVKFRPKAAEPVDTWYIELKEPVNSFSPKMSPDGRYVSFGVGWPWDPPYLYKLYFFDRQTQRVLAGPPESTAWQLSYWAPDSDKLAFLAGDELRVYSLKAGKSFLIVRDPGVNDLTWTEQNTLLVTRLAANVEQKTKKAAVAKTSKAPKALVAAPLESGETTDASEEEPLVEDVLRPLAPSVFEFAATGGAGKLMLEGVRYAVPSPDGRWLAYYGLAQEPPPYSEYSPLTAAQKKNLTIEERRAQERERSRKRAAFIEAINRPRFCLYDRVAKRRYLLAEQPNFDVTTLIWMRDSHRLIFMTRTYNEELREEDMIARAQFGVLDVTGNLATETIKPLASIEEVDKIGFPRPYYAPQFQILGVSKSGDSLVVKTNRITGRVLGAELAMTSSLSSIDLKSGAVIELARIKRADYDWNDESVAASAPGATTEVGHGGKSYEKD